MKNNTEQETNQLDGFIDYINSVNKVKRKNIGVSGSASYIPGVTLFEISTVILIAGPIPQVICSLTGNKLMVYNTIKILSRSEIDNLYDYALNKYKLGGFYYLLSGFDLSITDGSAHYCTFKWGEINLNEHCGHTLPAGIKELIDHCNKIVNT
jgi:hypothetical protein